MRLINTQELTSKDHDCRSTWSRRGSLFCSLLVTLLITGEALAHLPGLYGKEFIRTSASAPEPDLPAASAGPVDYPERDHSGLYQQMLERLEQQGGPYGDRLTEPLMGLARSLQSQGDYEEAIALNQRALHIIRVNDGLHSGRQLPLVRQLLQLYRITGDFESLDKGYDYLFRLHGTGQPPYSNERVAVALEYLDWQREVHCAALDRSNQRLVALYMLNQRLLQAQLAEATPNPSVYHDLVMSQLHNLYLILGQDIERGQHYNVASSGNIQPSQAASSAYAQQRIANLQATGVGRGQRLLQSLMDQTAADQLVGRAGLHLAMGDWYQWNDMRPKATGQYNEVVQVLTKAGEVALLEQWLGAPAELPGARVFCNFGKVQPGSQAAVVTALYRVSERGQVEDLQVSTADAANKVQGQRIARMLRQMHFRPRFLDGQPEAVQQVRRQYVLRD